MNVVRVRLRVFSSLSNHADNDLSWCRAGAMAKVVAEAEGLRVPSQLSPFCRHRR